MEQIIESISAIWGDEYKSEIECFCRVLNFLLLLKNNENLLFGMWYEKASSKKKALEKKVELNLEYIQRLVTKKWDKQFTDISTKFSLWTGHEMGELSAQTRFCLGLHANQPGLYNTCVNKLPRHGERMKFYQKDENKNKLISIATEFWLPDKILINGKDFLNIH